MSNRLVEQVLAASVGGAERALKTYLRWAGRGALSRGPTQSVPESLSQHEIARALFSSGVLDAVTMEESLRELAEGQGIASGLRGRVDIVGWRRAPSGVMRPVVAIEVKRGDQKLLKDARRLAGLHGLGFEVGAVLSARRFDREDEARAFFHTLRTTLGARPERVAIRRFGALGSRAWWGAGAFEIPPATEDQSGTPRSAE